MTKSIIGFAIGFAVVSVFASLLLIAFGFSQTRTTFAGEGGLGARSCTVASSTVATVGHQFSTVILATTTNRAWARIAQPINATNTVSIAFSNDARATLTSGFSLTTATSTSPIVDREFGLNTDFAYTGAVTGLSSTGSTTIHVVECRY